MSILGVKIFMSCLYVHEIRNHVHIIGLQMRCKKQLFLIPHFDGIYGLCFGFSSYKTCFLGGGGPLEK